MIVRNGSRMYHVGDRVAETPEYRLYLCSPEGDGQGQLLQVATDVAQNGMLDRGAYFLEQLLARAGELEEMYTKIKTNPESKLHYELGFPALVDSFLLTEQGERRANVLAFRNIDDTRRMVPLHNVVHRDQQRVDLRSSVWILGKLLKIVAFAHGADITINQITPGNVLIEPSQHGVLVFNWGNAQRHPDGVTRIDASEEVKAAAQTVFAVLGGTDEGGIPGDGSKEFDQYSEYLMVLRENGHRSAQEAHRDFYELVDQLWERGFYPFTTLPL